MSKTTLAYWISTGLFCCVMALSGAGNLVRIERAVETAVALGYPIYFTTIIGTAKLLGVMALLAPRLPLLKEWAYAGFTFNLLGAAATHLFVSDPLGDVLAPLIIMGLGATSYAYRPPARRLALAATPSPA